jgi:hypothetical protein
MSAMLSPLLRRAAWSGLALGLVGLAVWRNVARHPPGPRCRVPVLAIANPAPRADGTFARTIAWTDDAVAVGDGSAAAVRLFDVRTGNPRLTIPAPSASDRGLFGSALAGMGDDLAVGAPDDSIEAAQAGAVYVFHGANGTLVRRLANPRPNAGAMFGARIASDGTFLLVAAPRHRSGATGGGAAYLFEAASGRLLATFDNPWPGRCSEFGVGLALGRQSVIVGAPQCSDTRIDGAIFVFDRASGKRRLTIENPPSGPPSLFGHAVVARGDEILVAARQYQQRGAAPGAVFVFDAREGRLQAIVQNPTPDAEGSFGEPLVALADGRFAVAAPMAERVYIFAGRPARLTTTIESPAHSLARSFAATLFGTGLASRGSFLVVGAPSEDPRFAVEWSRLGLRSDRVPAHDPSSIGGAAYLYDLR